MKRMIFAILLASAFAALIGCAGRTVAVQPASLVGLRNPSIRILTDCSRKAPVKGTFGWGYCLFRVAPQAEGQLGAIGERLHRALQATLGAKGLALVESDPDLLVSYALASEAAINDEDLSGAYGELLRAPVAAAEPDMHYKRGVLVLDVAERRSGRLLWRGAIMADIELSWPEARTQERCDAAIAELLRHYPEPQSGGGHAEAAARREE